MKTTIDLNDSLLAAAQAAAAREQTTLACLVEEGLRLRLGDTADGLPSISLAIHRGQGGLSPAVKEPLRNCSLFDAADA